MSASRRQLLSRSFALPLFHHASFAGLLLRAAAPRRQRCTRSPSARARAFTFQLVSLELDFLASVPHFTPSDIVYAIWLSYILSGPDYGDGAIWAVAQAPSQLSGLHKKQ